MRLIFSLMTGALFGVVLVKSEVASWFRIQRMFRFEEAHMFLIMGSAVAVGALSLLLIRRLGLKDLEGKPVQVKEKPYQKGILVGGFLFGCGWAVTGTCPGPMYAQLGAGEAWAAFSFVGALCGAYLYAWLRPSLPH